MAAEGYILIIDVEEMQVADDPERRKIVGLTDILFEAFYAALLSAEGVECDRDGFRLSAGVG